ncbi:MAG: hypothetical protein O3C54_01745 [Proteobacteria bacterium]|nr:hypothetical protein [Pseudomonadota bacterium]
MKKNLKKLTTYFNRKGSVVYLSLLGILYFSAMAEASQLKDLETASKSAVAVIDGPLGYIGTFVGTGIGLWGALQKGSLVLGACVLIIAGAFVWNLDMLQARFMGS